MKYPHSMKDIEKTKIKFGKRQIEVVLDNFIIKKQITERGTSGSCRVTQKILDHIEICCWRYSISFDSRQPSFINLIRMGIPSSVRVICRKTLKQKLDQAYFDMKSTLEKNWMK